jgi:hypothetical protein
MVDQMAVDQGVDPIEFRLERMGATPKARKVFEALAQMADYKAPPTSKPSNVIRQRTHAKSTFPHQASLSSS